jgi:hypothetical protein
VIDPIFAWVARLVLAGVFAAAALHKWRDLSAFSAALGAHRLVPDALVPALARAFAACETSIAAGLVWTASAAPAAGAAAALLALYSGAIAINLARGRREIECGCRCGGAAAHTRTAQATRCSPRRRLPADPPAARPARVGGRASGRRGRARVVWLPRGRGVRSTGAPRRSA